MAAYRANVLALLRGLASRGARPALLVHGNPAVGGEAATWWREVGKVADVVYEAYYRATNISKLGRIVGPRRMRLGMRSIIRKFASAGVPREPSGSCSASRWRPGSSAARASSRARNGCAS